MASAVNNIVFVGGIVGTGQNGDNVTLDLTSLTGGVASSPSENDIVVVFGAEASTLTVGSIAGYTTIHETTANSGEDTAAISARKFMTSSPDSSVTFTAGSGDTANCTAAIALVFRNVDLTTPLDVSAVETSAADTALADPASITPTHPSSILAFGGAAHNQGEANDYGTPSDLDAFFTDSKSDTNDILIGGGYALRPPGAFDPEAWTWAGTDSTNFSYVAHTIALRSA